MRGQLVNIPGAGTDGWRDSHEGGLYVMMCVPEPADMSPFQNCHVDVSVVAAQVRTTALRMTAPDAKVSVPDGIWRPYDHENHRDGWNIMNRVLGRAKTEGDDDLVRWLVGSWQPEDISAPMLAAVHAGSTHQALWSDERSQYWEATEADLTATGWALWGALEKAYGITPLLCTLLDT